MVLRGEMKVTQHAGGSSSYIPDLWAPGSFGVYLWSTGRLGHWGSCSRVGSAGWWHIPQPLQTPTWCSVARM